MIKDNLAYKRWDMIIYHIISSIKKYIFHIFFYRLMVRVYLFNLLFFMYCAMILSSIYLFLYESFGFKKTFFFIYLNFF